MALGLLTSHFDHNITFEKLHHIYLGTHAVGNFQLFFVVVVVIMQEFASEFLVRVLAFLVGGYIFSVLFRTIVMQPFFGNINVRVAQIQEHLSYIQEQLTQNSREIDTIRTLAMIQRLAIHKIQHHTSICLSCGRSFESRNKLFQHLASTPKHEV